jgi:uncharacterized protein DUF4329
MGRANAGYEPSVYRGYDTAPDAAGGALADMDPRSISEDREYYTVVARARGRYFAVRADGQYLVGEQNSSPGSQSLITQARALGYEVTGYVHTHSMPNAQAWQESEFFSPSDMRFAAKNGVDMYLGTPSGAMRTWSLGEYANPDGQALGNARWLPFRMVYQNYGVAP